MSESASVIRIHPDRIITHQDFASQAKDTLLISGTFMTIQGEGPFAGHPAFFIRMAGCNYGDKEKHCGGKGLSCDTDFRYDKGKTVHVDDLLDELRESRAKVLVLTGGEPLLQAAGTTGDLDAQADALLALLDADYVSHQLIDRGRTLATLGDGWESVARKLCAR